MSLDLRRLPRESISYHQRNDCDGHSHGEAPGFYPILAAVCFQPALGVGVDPLQEIALIGVEHLLKALGKLAPDIGGFISGESGQSSPKELRTLVGIEVPRRREELGPEVFQADTILRL
jgi:hypothetical protein